MSKSIIQQDKTCYICGSTNWLEEHHIFGGALRKKSEHYGLKVFLCHYHHNEPPMGVHHNKDAMLFMKQTGQLAFEERYGHRKFMDEFGRNWL